MENIMDNVGIYLGTTPDSIKASQEAIMAILEARTDEKTKRAALKTLQSVSGSPSGNSISNCHIIMGIRNNVCNWRLL